MLYFLVGSFNRLEKTSVFLSIRYPRSCPILSVNQYLCGTKLSWAFLKAEPSPSLWGHIPFCFSMWMTCKSTSPVLSSRSTFPTQVAWPQATWLACQHLKIYMMNMMVMVKTGMIFKYVCELFYYFSFRRWSLVPFPLNMGIT